MQDTTTAPNIADMIELAHNIPEAPSDFDTMADVRAANAAHGGGNGRPGYFFDRGALREFSSVIESTVYRGGVFITSEQVEIGEYREPRRYNLRLADRAGVIHTLTLEGKFTNIEDARQAARAVSRALTATN